jgi:phosphoribosyl-AMP cyclohydrolase
MRTIERKSFPSNRLRGCFFLAIKNSRGVSFTIFGQGVIFMIKLDFSKGNGLLPAIVQEHGTGKVLMLAYINETSWERTLETGEAHYWSRSRQELWHKGGTSGHVQRIKSIFVDCDNDTVLFQVHQVGGAACHTGFDTCFHKKIHKNGDVDIVGNKIFDPERVYKK